MSVTCPFCKLPLKPEATHEINGLGCVNLQLHRATEEARRLQRITDRQHEDLVKFDDYRDLLVQGVSHKDAMNKIWPAVWPPKEKPNGK